MDEDKKARVLAYVNTMEWKFSKRMPQWPHHYILRTWGREDEFDYLAGLIQQFGYEDKWNKRTDKYLVIDGLKYWQLDEVINRAEPISNEQMIKNGKEYMKTRGLKTGRWGCLIAI